MKRINICIVGIIPVIMLITSCAFLSNLTGGGKANSDELDTAIREASTYLNTRIPKGNKVAFINISGGYPDLADYILSDLSKHGVNDGAFSVVDRAQLEHVRAELNFNLSGEVSDQSAQEIGKMIGAQTIVSGSVRKIGASYRLDIKAIEVQTASVQGQWNRNIPNSATIDALTENTGGAGGTASSGSASSGNTAAAAPAAIANGTYTFWPRPQAIKAGIPVSAYIIKIVVNGRYMVFYMTNIERGTGNMRASPGYWYIRDNVLLTNLDRPSQTWRPSSHRDSPEGEILSFDSVTTARFSLECSWNGITIYEEVNLDDAEYEL